MKKTKNTLARIVATAVGASALLIAGTAHAALQDRDLDGNGEVDAFYDTDRDVTWLRNANVNGAMNWNTVNTWVAGFSFGGYDDWRLPTADCLNYDHNCWTDEWDHLWMDELGNVVYDRNFKTGSFQNLSPTESYWTSTEFTGGWPGVFVYAPGGWGYLTVEKDDDLCSGLSYHCPLALVLRDGDVPAVPEPQTYALMLAGLGALLVARRRRSD